jgi:hypothetical protein
MIIITTPNLKTTANSPKTIIKILITFNIIPIPVNKNKIQSIITELLGKRINHNAAKNLSIRKIGIQISNSIRK